MYIFVLIIEILECFRTSYLLAHKSCDIKIVYIIQFKSFSFYQSEAVIIGPEAIAKLGAELCSKTGNVSSFNRLCLIPIINLFFCSLFSAIVM